MNRFFAPFESLKNRLFLRFFAAQAINLFGDSLSWVALALLAFKISGEDSGTVLSTALTIRVAVFVLLSSIGGVVADRVSRKGILVTAHFARMVLIGLMPFVAAEWQIYLLVFGLNVFNSIFTPTYKSCIPVIIKDKEEYPKAIGLSSTVYQLLGILGPGAAGALVAWFGLREVFFMDVMTFLTAGIILLFIPGALLEPDGKQEAKPTKVSFREQVIAGSKPLFQNKSLRLNLLMQLVASVIGAQVLVNTVGMIRGEFGLGDMEYGWAMTAFGAGATIAAFVSGALKKNRQLLMASVVGGLLISLALFPVPFADFEMILFLWLIVGASESFINIPMQSLIARKVAHDDQGKVYGAHFAWSHLWWAFAYPVAGVFGEQGKDSFLYAGILALFIWLAFLLVFGKNAMRDECLGED